MAAIVASAPGAFAQAAPPAPAAPVPTTPAKEQNTTTLPRRNRAVSPEVAASISAAMPKYNPPKPVEKKPEAETPDLRETDKPKNEIVRLPDYVVRDRLNPILRERDVYTKEGLADLATRRHFTDAGKALNRFTVPLFSPISTSGSGSATTDRALLMYTEEERLKNMADLSDAAGLVSARDKAAGAYVKREALKTYNRTDDFGWKNTTNK